MREDASRSQGCHVTGRQIRKESGSGKLRVLLILSALKKRTQVREGSGLEARVLSEQNTAETRTFENDYVRVSSTIEPQLVEASGIVVRLCLPRALVTDSRLGPRASRIPRTGDNLNPASRLVSLKSTAESMYNTIGPRFEAAGRLRCSFLVRLLYPFLFVFSILYCSSFLAFLVRLSYTPRPFLEPPERLSSQDTGPNTLASRRFSKTSSLVIFRAAGMENSTTSATAGAGTSGAESFDFALYRYKLSLPAAIAAVVVFLILTLLHVWRIYRHRSFYFTAFTLGGCCTYRPGMVPLPFQQQPLF